MSIHTVIRQPAGVATVVTSETVSHAVSASGAATQLAVTTVTTGVRGEKGLPGLQGLQGVPGPAGADGVGSDRHHTHTQAVPSDTWVIAHNLGKYPSVSVVDSSGGEVEGEVSHTSPNQLTVVFSAGFSGSAYLN